MTPKAAKKRNVINEGMPALPASGQGRPLHGSIDFHAQSFGVLGGKFGQRVRA
jgi:hypothetical protein